MVASRNYGGLKDEDRIFTNIYGRHDWRLKGALKVSINHHPNALSCLHSGALIEISYLFALILSFREANTIRPKRFCSKVTSGSWTK